MTHTNASVLSLIYSENIKITIDVAKKEFTYYFIDDTAFCQSKFSRHKKLFSTNRYLRIKNCGKRLDWKCEKVKDTILSIKLAGMLFRVADTNDENQIRLFDEFLFVMFG